jgi:adenylate cyclase
MLDFLGLDGPVSQRPRIDPTANRERLNSLFRRLVRIAGAERPRVFLLEDLHWVDSGSESLIEVMVEALQGTRILLIVNYRPGYSAPWMHGDHFDQVSLSPLRQTAAESLATQLLGDDQSVLQLLPLIADRARGNPLFIEELVGSFQESGFLAGERGAYRLLRAPDIRRVPDTVQAIIGARIDSRPEAEKSILQTAAVIGREFALTLLSRLVGPLTTGLENVLYRLSSAGLVYESATRTGVFAFRHPMVQDVAYRSLVSERRRALHASVAAELEKTLPDANGAQAGFIAYHWEEAGNPMQAASFNMKAATWHGTRDPTQAIDAWKRVRRLLQGLGLQGPARYPLIMANGQIINLGWREGMAAADVAPLYTEALEIAHSLGDMRAVTLLTLAYGRALAATGSAADYVATATDVFAQLDDKRDPSLKVVGAAVLSQALRHAGQLQQALDANDVALKGLDQVSDVDQQTLGFNVGVWVKAIRANILAMMDRIDEAGSLADALIAADETTVDALHRMMAHFVYIDIAWGTGDAELAARHAAAVTQLADKSGTPYLQVYGRAYVGLARAIGGEHAETARALSENLTYARQRNAGLDIEARMLADLAYVQLRAGLVTRARATAEEAASVARRRGAMVWLAYAELLIGGPQSPTFAELVNLTGAKLLQRLPYPRLQT